MKKIMKNIKSYLLKLKKENGQVIFFLYIFSITMALIGFLIVIIFICVLGNEYSITGSEHILLQETGQVGDFIGGLVGSLWAFSGVILYFIAISLQRKDNIDKEKENTIERIITIIYNQYKIIKDSQKTLKLNKESPENVAPHFRQYIYNNIGIPRNENLNPQIGVSYLAFSKSNSFHNYRKVIIGSIKIIQYLLKQSKNLNIDELNNLIFLVNSNFNIKELEELFEADLALVNFINEPENQYSKDYNVHIRNLALDNNTQLLDLIKQIKL